MQYFSEAWRICSWEQLFGLPPVAFKGDKNRDFIPDVVEPDLVVGQCFPKDLAVGDVDDSAGALVGIHPVAHLHHAELKEPDVDHIALGLPDLDAIAYGERLSRHDEKPAGDIGNGVVHGHGYARAGKTDQRRQTAQALDPDASDQKNEQYRVEVKPGPAPAIDPPDIFDAFFNDEIEEHPGQRKRNDQDDGQHQFLQQLGGEM